MEPPSHHNLAIRRPVDPATVRQRLGQGLLRLAAAGLLASALFMHAPGVPGWQPLLALTATCLAAGLLVGHHVRHVRIERTDARTAERLLYATTLFAVVGVQVANLSVTPLGTMGVAFLLLAPAVAQAMLVSALVGPSLALTGLTTSCLLLGIGGGMPVELILASWIAGAVGAHAVSPLRHRSDLLRALSVQVLAQTVIALALSAITAVRIAPVLESMLWAAIAAVLATSTFWLGVAVVERVSGIVSDWSLLELCSPDHPLMHELVLRAPGTHAHSVGVANLAEAAARAIGANSVLCRALAYYHDVGKSQRPAYFVENQRGENLHDGLPPTVSAQIIASHVADGVQLANAHRLPAVIVDGIRQHHGTSLISYFYHRACQDTPGSVDSHLERLFRYDGPKPQTREVAILLLADQVEAVGRALRQADPIDAAVAGIIESNRADGQLDECDLTFRDLAAIRTTFVQTLEALRHDRVPYPRLEGDAPEPTSTGPRDEPVNPPIEP